MDESFKVEMEGMLQRQEGNDIRNDVQLHEREKALKGKAHEWIWSEIGPAGAC